MTGLALAYLLGKRGYRVSIIERGKELSGLLTYTKVGDVPIERYYHHFFTHDRYFLKLVHELGLDDGIIWQQGRSAIYHKGTVYPFITKLDYLKLPFLSLAAKIRGGVAALQMRVKQPEQLPPSLTAETYLRQMFGNEGWQKMWQPLLINKFGEDATRLSAQWIAKRIQIRSRSERKGREVLGYLNGSYKVLADALRERIVAQGGRIILECEVQQIPRDGKGRYQIHGEEYGIVVSTVAPDIIKRIVPDLDLPEVTYRSAICPLFILRKPITPYYWINILDTSVPFSVIVNQQALLPANYYNGLHPLYIGHYVSDKSPLLQQTDDELYRYYMSFLTQIFPGIEHLVQSVEMGRAKHTQPVVTAPWTPLEHKTNLPNFYTTSMAHIFPEDRGVNYAIREAERITRLLNTKYSESDL